MKGLRIGIPKEYRVDNMPPEIDALWDQGIAWLRASASGATGHWLGKHRSAVLPAGTELTLELNRPMTTTPAMPAPAVTASAPTGGSN